MAFSWDEQKREENWNLRKVDFAEAIGIFYDAAVIEAIDSREDYGEDRFIIVGMVEGRLLFVAYTMRGETIRIISARGAEPHEQRRYHEDNG